ncbi:MAG TPA: QueT transporter family protein [Clostridiales bacterium]|nr:QueT transporter family protein [Clostridiales bacterium]
MNNQKTQFIVNASMIASIYTVLVIMAAPISFGPIQFRIAEALTVLPFFTPAAIPGVTIGCFLSAILTGADILDIIFGTLATLIASTLSYKLRNNKYLVPLPPVISNALIIPWVLKYAYAEAMPIYFMMASVAIGEVFACYGLGLILLFSLKKINYIFKLN